MESLIHKLKQGHTLNADDREILISLIRNSGGDESAFEKLYERSRQLTERVKELQCLYSIMKRLQNSENSPESIWQEIVNLIPSGFQHPDLTTASLTISSNSYLSENEHQGESILSIPVTVGKQEIGTLSVCFREDSINGIKASLLDEEVELVKSIADLIKGFIERVEADRSARRNKQLLDAITQQTKAAVWVRDGQGRHILVNEEWRKIFELGDQAVIGKTAGELFDPSLAMQFKENDQKVRKSRQPIVFEETVQTPGGVREYVTHIFPITGISGLEDAVGGIATDITEQKLHKRKLRDTEEKLRTIIEHSTNLFYTHTTDHEITYISPQSEVYFGYPPEEAERRWIEFATDNPVNLEGIKVTEKAIKTGERQPPYELELKKKDGSIIWVEVYEAPILKDGETVGIAGSLTDITEQKLAREELKQSLQEKETLLAEIHHRVKNNLAVISGMLYLQATEETEHSRVYQKLMDSVTRIKAMAQIHEQLYQSKSFSMLDFTLNLQELITGILDTLQSDIVFTTEFQCDPVQLNMNQALPASLIVNEVITNIMKHAYPGKSTGTVRAELTEKDGRIRLKILDDGIGLPDDFMIKQNQGLGLHLIALLSDQIGATFRFENQDQGSRFSLTFEKNTSV